MPCFNGGTAVAEMLCSLDTDYIDEQDVIEGLITRKNKILVLTGYEDWTESGDSGTNNHRFVLSDPINASTTKANKSLCTHVSRIIQTNTISQSNRPCIRFNTSGSSLVWCDTDNSTSLESFKQWLVNQYEGGTPVIVIYPLANSVSETVAGQPMNTTNGENVVTITQAALNNLELDVTYIKRV